MTGYRVTQWRDVHGQIWEQVPHSGAWSADGAYDVYDTVDALREAWGPLTVVDVDDVSAMLAELEQARNERDQWRQVCEQARDAFGELMAQHLQLRADAKALAAPKPPPDTSWPQTPEVHEGDKRRSRQ